jgi:hypothetical protein
MKFQQYIANVGERWDTISQANYNTPYLYERIQRANPEAMGDKLVMSMGRVLLVPVLEASEVATVAAQVDVSKLPPWRR